MRVDRNPEGHMLTHDTKSSNIASTGFRAPQLTDERIATLAVQALARENIDPGRRRIAVHVERGWITLSGRASHPVERSAAECVVRYVPGVAGVTNQLVITLADR